MSTAKTRPVTNLLSFEYKESIEAKMKNLMYAGMKEYWLKLFLVYVSLLVLFKR